MKGRAALGTSVLLTSSPASDTVALPALGMLGTNAPEAARRFGTSAVGFSSMCDAQYEDRDLPFENFVHDSIVANSDAAEAREVSLEQVSGVGIPGQTVDYRDDP